MGLGYDSMLAKSLGIKEKPKKSKEIKDKKDTKKKDKKKG